MGGIRKRRGRRTGATAPPGLAGWEETREEEKAARSPRAHGTTRSLPHPAWLRSQPAPRPPHSAPCLLGASAPPSSPPPPRPSPPRPPRGWARFRPPPPPPPSSPARRRRRAWSCRTARRAWLIGIAQHADADPVDHEVAAAEVAEGDRVRVGPMSGMSSASATGKPISGRLAWPAAAGGVVAVGVLELADDRSASCGSSRSARSAGSPTSARRSRSISLSDGLLAGKAPAAPVAM